MTLDLDNHRCLSYTDISHSYLWRKNNRSLVQTTILPSQTEFHLELLYELL